MDSLDCIVFKYTHYAGIFEGIPPYPLYKRLALALHESMASGTLFGTCNNLTIIHQESLLKEKENEWQKLILEKGSELVNVNYN